MTLILTWATKFGIAMAADSAVTEDGRSLLGVQKLLPVRAIDAGIAAWGVGKIQEQHTDEWIQSFIKNQITETMSLGNAAQALADSLNNAFPEPLEKNSGMHLAGYAPDDNGIRYPTIYHIHNVQGEYKVGVLEGHAGPLPGDPPGRFRANQDLPPGPIPPTGYRPLRNGDIFLFNQLWFRMEPIFAELREQTDLKIPFPNSLESYGEYLRIWITFIGQLYRQSNRYSRNIYMPTTVGGASIGGPVSVLTINQYGIQSFYAA